MPQSRFPPSLNAASDKSNIPKWGYVRSRATHLGAKWNFEQLSEDQKIALVTIETRDGPVQIGLNREEATVFQQKLQLFLQDWPKDQAGS